MGGAEGSFFSTFQSTERPAGFLMRARCTSGLWGMLYEAASMLRMDGKGVGGRAGYMSLPLGLEKGESVEVNVSSKQWSELQLWVSVSVCITCSESVCLGLWLSPGGRLSTFTLSAFGSSNCLDSSSLFSFSCWSSGSFFMILTCLWITQHDKRWVSEDKTQNKQT